MGRRRWSQTVSKRKIYMVILNKNTKWDTKQLLLMSFTLIELFSSVKYLNVNLTYNFDLKPQINDKILKSKTKFMVFCLVMGCVWGTKSKYISGFYNCVVTDICLNNLVNRLPATCPPQLRSVNLQ